MFVFYLPCINISLKALCITTAHIFFKASICILFIYVRTFSYCEFIRCFYMYIMCDSSTLPISPAKHMKFRGKYFAYHSQLNQKKNIICTKQYIGERKQINKSFTICGKPKHVFGLCIGHITMYR